MPKQKKKPLLPEYMTTVTPFSKCLALALFIMLPIGAFIYGIKYERARSAEWELMKSLSENNVNFTCDAGKAIQATFYAKDSSHVSVKLSDGRTLFLAHAISADGNRFTNSDESIVFWNKGNTALISENKKSTYTNCVESSKN